MRLATGSDIRLTGVRFNRFLRAHQRAERKRTSSEKFTARVEVRPELEKALQLARDIKGAVPDRSWWRVEADPPMDRAQELVRQDLAQWS